MAMCKLFEDGTWQKYTDLHSATATTAGRMSTLKLCALLVRSLVVEAASTVKMWNDRLSSILTPRLHLSLLADWCSLYYYEMWMA